MKKIMKLMAVAVMLALIIPVTANAQGKPNFAGNWTLNAEKSTQPQGGQGGGGARMGGGAANMTVTQDATTLTIESTRANRDGGTAPVTTKYTLDGKETTSTSNFGDSKSTATWAPDGKTLKVIIKRTFERDGQSTTMTTTEEWTMAGNNLQVKRTATTPNGDRVTTSVYDKK
jgi:dipeptidyl aminopeptidase/acylaminoacyl peptidase